MGPGSSGERALGHKITTVTLCLTNPTLQRKVGQALWSIEEEGMVLVACQEASSLLFEEF